MVAPHASAPQQVSQTRKSAISFLRRTMVVVFVDAVSHGTKFEQCENLPCNPTRFCRKMAGPSESKRIANAINTITGNARIIPTVDQMTDEARLYSPEGATPPSRGKTTTSSSGEIRWEAFRWPPRTIRLVLNTDPSTLQLKQSLHGQISSPFVHREHDSLAV